ncbi:MAG: adenylosuccinate lyase [Bacteriovoracaceae bacterium]|nr:adenylosuccinate lyase [Bacteriovoracaceae bacterium]
MVPRYEQSEISHIWSDQHKFETYLKVELAILKALEGTILPKGLSQTIKNSAVINPGRIEEIENKVKHDVIAFCTSITENLEPEISKYFHFGVTSSDIIDSSLTISIQESLSLIIPAFKQLLTAIKTKAEETKELICIGRSHGMCAEPMSFGTKWLSFYAELSRRFNDLKQFFKEELTVQFSGAVGNYTILSPEAESKAALELGLKVEPLSTQVIPRDRIAKLISINALIAAALERMAVEIRHLHHSDVSELHEGFKKGQKGSSTMPHKKNPISSENLTGIARVLKSHVQIALDNIVLWHERDISHSSAERLYLPDNLGLLLYAIKRMASTVENLQFHREHIEQKVKDEFSYLSSYYLHQLVLHTDFTREESYELIQKAAFEGKSANSAEVFYEALTAALKEKDVTLALNAPSFEEVGKIYLKHVDSIFSRTLELYKV